MMKVPFTTYYEAVVDIRSREDTLTVVGADDHAVVREGTRQMLEREDGIEVIGEVPSVADAIDAAQRLAPTLMVIDVELLDGSGVDVVRHVVERGLPVRCLMLSAHDDYVYFSEALAAGANGYLLKTISTDEFIAAVRTIALGGTVIDGVLSHRLAGRRRQLEERVADTLTAREFDVIRGLVRGRSNKEIARDLGVGLRTVESYVSAVLAKLGVRSRSEAIVYVLEHHLVSPSSAK
jgi:DNA-binding NarL/FixJ family response regulator